MFPATARLVFAGITGWLLLSAAFSQGAAQDAEPPGETPLETGIEERVEVRIMEISLLALDEDGRPVTDLEIEDLEQPMRALLVAGQAPRRS